jgi:hypothetical protein
VLTVPQIRQVILALNAPGVPLSQYSRG